VFGATRRLDIGSMAGGGARHDGVPGPPLVTTTNCTPGEIQQVASREKARMLEAKCHTVMAYVGVAKCALSVMSEA